jgi:hypothetical protein
MRRFILILLTIVALGFSYAQERPSYILPPCDDFTVDLHGNLYLWKDAVLEKHSETGKVLAQYSNPSLGTIRSVDASIPSKILVFHQESGTLVLLDNTLSPAGNALSLFDHNLYSITLAAFAGTNRIALFDDAAQQLLLTDLDLNIVNSTPIDAGSDFHPALIDVSLDKNILLSDSLLGILFFDKFGSFERKLPLTGVKSLQMQGEHLYYLQEGNLYNYDLSALDIILVANGLSGVKAFRRTNSTLYLLNDKGALIQRPVLRTRR